MRWSDTITVISTTLTLSFRRITIPRKKKCNASIARSSHLFPNNRQINYQKREREREREKERNRWREVEEEWQRSNFFNFTRKMNLINRCRFKPKFSRTGWNIFSQFKRNYEYDPSKFIRNCSTFYFFIRSSSSLFHSLSLSFCRKIFPKTRRIYAWIKTR